MANFVGLTGESGDLFGDASIPGRERLNEPGFAPELKAARKLCRQLRHKAARPDKMRIAHLICLNLRSMLRTPGKMQRACD
jgi:hypothetical protein